MDTPEASAAPVFRARHKEARIPHGILSRLQSSVVGGH
jgi:hypothetical protein